MSGDDYGQAFHDGETTGAAEELRAILKWLREDAAPRDIDGASAIRSVADCIERGLHHRWAAQATSEDPNGTR